MGPKLSVWRTRRAAIRARANDQVHAVALVDQKSEESWIVVFKIDLREELDNSLTIVHKDVTQCKPGNGDQLPSGGSQEEGATAAASVCRQTGPTTGGPPIILIHPRRQRVPGLMHMVSYSIKCAGSSTLSYQWQHHCDSNLMTMKGEQASSVIRQHFPQLVQDINRPDRLGEMLLSWKVITADEFEEVSVQPARARKCDILIHIFMRRVHSQPHLFHSFCNYLEQERVTTLASIQEIYEASFKDDEGWEDVQEGDGKRIEGTTTSKLTIVRVEQPDVGCYRCIVRNSAGQISVSEMAPLTIAQSSSLDTIEEETALSTELTQYVSDKVMPLERSPGAKKSACQTPDDSGDTKPHDGDTELHSACRRATPDEVETMICCRRPPPDLNAANKAGQTPLHVACARGNARIVKCLLSHDTASLDAKDINGNLPIHLACLKNDYEVVKALLKTKKCKLDQLNEDCDTPLHIAVQEQNLDIVKKLVKYNPKVVNQPNRILNTPLHIACSAAGNSVKIVKCLKEKAVMTMKNNDGQTPLEVAEHNEKFSIVEALGSRVQRIKKRLHRYSSTRSLNMRRSCSSHSSLQSLRSLQ